MRATVQQFAEQTPPERWIAVDSRPGRIAYDRGGLTEAEIRIVEDTT